MPINLSHKTYWNLDGFRKGSETVEEHRLHLPFSGFRLEEDESQIPTGDIKGNKPGSEFDFWSSPKLLAGGLARKGSYDDLFLVNRHQPWEVGSNPVALLSSSKSGISVGMYTDQEAVRLVTWDDSKGMCRKERFLKSTEISPWVGCARLTTSNSISDQFDAQGGARWKKSAKECRHFNADDGLAGRIASSRVAARKAHSLRTGSHDDNLFELQVFGQGTRLPARIEISSVACLIQSLLLSLI